MLTFIFSIMMAVIFGRLLIFALRCAWGVGRVLFTLLFLPLLIIGAAAQDEDVLVSDLRHSACVGRSVGIKEFRMPEKDAVFGFSPDGYPGNGSAVFPEIEERRGVSKP